MRCRELDTFKIIVIFWNIFGLSLEFFWNCLQLSERIFLGVIFWEDFFGEDFFGRIFWENFLGGFFGRIFSEGIQKKVI